MTAAIKVKRLDTNSSVTKILMYEYMIKDFIHNCIPTMHIGCLQAINNCFQLCNRTCAPGQHYGDLQAPYGCSRKFKPRRLFLRLRRNKALVMSSPAPRQRHGVAILPRRLLVGLVVHQISFAGLNVMGNRKSVPEVSMGIQIPSSQPSGRCSATSWHRAVLKRRQENTYQASSETIVSAAKSAN